MLVYPKKVEEEYKRKIKRNFKISLAGTFLGMALCGYGVYERAADLEKPLPYIVTEYKDVNTKLLENKGVYNLVKGYGEFINIQSLEDRIANLKQDSAKIINNNLEVREYLKEESESSNSFLYKMAYGTFFSLFSLLGISNILNYYTRKQKEKHF